MLHWFEFQCSLPNENSHVVILHMCLRVMYEEGRVSDFGERCRRSFIFPGERQKFPQRFQASLSLSLSVSLSLFKPPEREQKLLTFLPVKDK